MSQSSVYMVIHTDTNVYCPEAFGLPGNPVFGRREDAERMAEAWAEAWPEDAPARDEYAVVEYPTLADAQAERPAAILVDEDGRPVETADHD